MAKIALKKLCKAKQLKFWIEQSFFEPNGPLSTPEYSHSPTDTGGTGYKNCSTFKVACMTVAIRFML